MKLIPPPNIASSVIAVTNTATVVTTLMDTAGSITTSLSYSKAPANGGPANGILITPEDGSIRLGYGVVPTAALGMLLSQGVTYKIPNVNIESIKLIRTGSSNVSCSVNLISTGAGEGIEAGIQVVNVSLAASDIEIGAVELKDGATDTRAVINAANTARTAATVVVATQVIDEAGAVLKTSTLATAAKQPTLGTGVMTGSAPMTIATDDTVMVNIKKALTGAGSPTAFDSYGSVAINLAAGADQVLVSSAPGKQIWVYGFAFTTNVAGLVSFQDEDNVALSGIMQIGVTGGIAISPSGNFDMPIWKLGTDKDLEVDITTAELDGTLFYAIITV